MLLYQLGRPFSYLWIKGAGKLALDWIAPTIFGVISSVFLCVLPSRPQLYLPNGVFAEIASLLQNLPGFYIAALAAIAVFQREGFDRPLPQPTPTINVKIGQTWVSIDLTRRRLLTLLFGYLSAISFVLYLFIVFLNAAARSVHDYVDPRFMGVTGWGGAFVVMTLLGHLLCVTAFGLYQLSDRIFQPDQVRQPWEPGPPY